jgi:hypothetical protein
MPGEQFFQVVLLLATAFFGFAALAGLRRRTLGWDESAAAGLRVSMEFSLMAIALGLLPFPIYYTLGLDSVMWSLLSLIMAALLMIQMGRLFYKANSLRARWPLMAGLILVVSAVFVTIELLNSFRWSALDGYAWGLMFILGVAGVQFVAFTTLDRRPFSARDDFGNVPIAHHAAVSERMRRERETHRADRTANPYANLNRDGNPDSQRQPDPNRYPYTRPDHTNGRAIPHAPVRPNQDPRRR